tara:strand:- start:189 stop:443 length:255 start_codon:yes stop_codon:yes gene_type:complete
MTPQTIRQMIEAGLPDSSVVVESEDNTHFTALIISKLFSGKNMLQQHKMVHKVLGDKLGKDIHALSFKTFTPEEYESISSIESS